MDKETWRELVDLDRLSAWMDAEGLAHGPIEDAALLGVGTQNILLSFRRGGRSFVLRRPPKHPRLDGNTTIQREARMLRALASTDVPHPRIIAGCPSAEVLGAAFYLMEPVKGFNAADRLPPLHAAEPALRRRMGLALAEGAAILARIDYVAAGLADMGKIDGFLERQVGRWKSYLEGYREYEGWPGPTSLPSVDAVGKWLEGHRPRVFSPGIMHGDYHIANVMYRDDSPELAAIVDWELTTIGDPLIDLGWLIATWPGADGVSPAGFKVRPWSGFPTAHELAQAYAEKRRCDLPDLDWYVVLACYKLGIVVEGTYARALAGKARMATGEELHGAAIKLFERALQWMDGAEA